MSRLSLPFIANLREDRNKERPEWDDVTRGVLLAMIKESQTIWNSKAKLSKDDVMSCFQQIADILSNVDPRFNAWAILEKWCWMVEIYIRSSSASSNIDWRYQNTMHFLTPFNSPTYPYMRCISHERLIELTEKYEKNCRSMCISSEVIWKTINDNGETGIFREELAFYAGESDEVQSKPEVVFKPLVMNGPKRRGRPPKHCFEKTVGVSVTPSDSGTSAPTSGIEPSQVIDENGFDQLGFSKEMYDFLIDEVREKAELWHNRHPNRENKAIHDKLYTTISKDMAIKFEQELGKERLVKINADFIKTGWEAVKNRFFREEQNKEESKWVHYPKLVFLSHRVMPAYRYDSVYLKTNNDPSTSSAGISPRSDGSQSNRETSKSPRVSNMASQSPIQISVSSQKSLQSVLDSLVAAQMKSTRPSTSSDDSEVTLPLGEVCIANPAMFSELQKILTSSMAHNKSIIIPSCDTSAPASKKMRASSPVSTTRVVIGNGKNNADTTISTWVPPKEDISVTSSSSVKTEAVTPKKSVSNGNSTATAVIKTNSNPIADKHLRKIQQSIAASLVKGPVTRNGIMNMSPISMQNPAIAQALFTPKVDNVSTIRSAPIQMNGNGDMNGKMVATTTAASFMPTQLGMVANKPTSEDKWSSLGKMISATSREVESRDPILACHLFKDLQDIIFQYQIKSLTPKSSDK